jgi:hypothetical protein
VYKAIWSSWIFYCLPCQYGYYYYLSLHVKKQELNCYYYYYYCYYHHHGEESIFKYIFASIKFMRHNFKIPHRDCHVFYCYLWAKFHVPFVGTFVMHPHTECHIPSSSDLSLLPPDQEQRTAINCIWSSCCYFTLRKKNCLIKLYIFRRHFSTHYFRTDNEYQVSLVSLPLQGRAYRYQLQESWWPLIYIS